MFYGSPHVETRLRHSLAGSDSARAIGETVAPTSTEKKKKETTEFRIESLLKSEESRKNL